MTTEEFIRFALKEDLGIGGDHTSKATIPDNAMGKAKLLVKEKGVISGIHIAQKVFEAVDRHLVFHQILHDGDLIEPGDIAFTLEGKSISILSGERLALNFMQRMSGIASFTRKLADKIKDYPATLLDTRKTTPNLRIFEKQAVKDGGGENHRMGLYDMMMIKDNHIDFSGGIEKAIDAANHYQKEHGIDIKIEIEVRNFQELEQVLRHGKVDRLMLDNFSPDDLAIAVKQINHQVETEASGGIDENTIEDYAKTGVDFISVGALTHHIQSLDLSLKAMDGNV